MLRILLGIISLLIAGGMWIPTFHLLYRPGPEEFAPPRGVPEDAEKLIARFRSQWAFDPPADEPELKALHRSNAEWDFMSRTYLVWSLANVALREPDREPSALELMDRIIDDTLRLEKEEGLYYFLMPYARSGRWAMSPPRSQFIDGEIALMLACRRIVAERPSYKLLLARRIELMLDRMRQSPVLSAESYPDECWTFCNTTALAAIRMADHLDGTDHSRFLDRWLATAKRKLIDPRTGLLVSSYTVSGQALDGPEGSSIWMVCHNLQLIDRDFAADQYRRAKKQLARSILGFGYAREWPESWAGPLDVDSATIIPGLDLSVGSSGQAFVAASAFDDNAFLSSLAASLRFGALADSDDGRLRYCASNGAGDAVVLYSMVLGPVWEKVARGGGP